MNVQDAPHRRLGDPCCGAARQPKISLTLTAGGWGALSDAPRPAGAGTAELGAAKYQASDAEAVTEALAESEAQHDGFGAASMPPPALHATLDLDAR